MVYQWKQGSRAKGNAQIAGTVCAELEAEGRLTAQELVDVSRPADAPLHDSFEWNDAVAAEEFRKAQARHIIQSIVVVEEGKAPSKIFYNISTEGNNYSNIRAIVKQKDRYDQLLKDALAEIRAFRKRYNSLVELNTLFDVIDTYIGSEAAGL